MEDNHDDRDAESASSDSFIDDSDEDKPTISDENDELHVEANLTEEEIEELIAEFFEAESKAAEAQESLEEESLRKVEDDVREELAQTLQGDDLEKAISDEMESYREEWETVLDEHETEISHLLEQLDGAGIDLPSLFKCIEGHAPNESSTEAWKKRIHWIGGKATSDVAEFVSDAEKYLKIHRPVRKKHGKVLEEGASGYLEKKLAVDDTVDAAQRTSVDWSSFNKLLSGHSSEDRPSFGNKLWASVYLASTPQQAAELGLDFPGMDEVEEIGDIEGDSSHPFMADALENEREPVLSEEQKKKFRKVKEEEDASLDKKLQLRLKHRRKRNINKQEAIWRGGSAADRLTDGSSNASGYDGKLASGSSEDDGPYIKTVDNCNVESFVGLNKSAPLSNGTVDMVSNNGVPDDSRGLKRFNDNDRSNIDVKKSRVIIVDSDNEDRVALDKASPVYPIPDMMGLSELKRDGDGSIPADHDPQKTVKAFHCTSCGIESAEVHSHPLLRVVICQDCKCLVEQKMHSKDLGSMEGYCAWCGGTQNLLTCMSCKTLFCGTCIKRNLGEGRLLQIQQSSWICCCCSPDMLQKLTSLLVNTIESKSLTTSSSDSDSGTSVTEIKFRASSKRKRKKKIRRILDDAELGEETKKKIAIEKERQERLKSLEAQFSRKAMPVDSKSFNCNYSEGASAEVLGDASTGYIVNVVREKGEEAVRIPPSLSRKLKPHQISGIRFMWENIIQSVTKVKSGDKGLGCILAHTMGLGKTLQVIAFLYSAMRSVDLGLGTALIVTPVSVLHNWRKEFLKWGPSELKPLRLFMLEDVSRERRAELLAKWKRKGGIFLMSYAAFRNLSFGKHVRDRQIASDMSLALQDGPDILVCDEAHMIKNTRADTTQALKQVKCQRRIALTGSPLQNNLMEYYCMVDFVREGFLGSSHEFRNRFQNPIENGQHTNSTSEDVKIMNQSSHILYEQLKGFVQRVDMNVMKNDLPPKTVFVIAVKLAPLQSKLYTRFLDVHGFRNVQVSSEKIQKRSFFAGYQALAQIWNHPGILQLKKPNKDYGKPEDADDNIFPYDSFSDENMDCNMVTEKQQTTRELLQGKHGTSFIRENWWKDLLQENTYKEIGYSGKMVLLLDIITMSSDVGDKTLVFSQSISTLDLVEYHLSKLTRCGKPGKFWKKGKDWYRLDGRTEALARQKLVEKFNDPSNKRVKCTLISTRAGSLGINLYAANRVVIVDGSWNPTYDLQAIYRAWRYGQTKPVFAYRLMAHGTMEEKIYKRQVTKEGLAARVVDRQQIYRTISKEEMLHLFDFGDDESSECYSEDGLENGDSKLPNGNVSSDKLMETLLNRHCPRWVVNYHEHETLLQENEDEKLSKEEQDMAWEVFRRRLEWEEAHRLNPENPAPTPNPWEEVKRVNLENPTTKPPPPSPAVVPQRIVPTTIIKSSLPARDRSRDRMVQRKCTNTAHLMTLQIQGTKAGCATICGECAKEIRWEDFERKPRV